MQRRSLHLLFLSTLLAVTSLIGHSQAKAPAFEVASIKPAAGGGIGGRGRGGGCPQSFHVDRHSADLRCITASALVGLAFGLPTHFASTTKDGGLSGSARFDVQGTLPADTSESDVPAMLQALLAERFQLSTHRENVEQEVYALDVIKSGAKLTSAASSATKETDTSAEPASIVTFGGVPTRMERIENGYVVTNSRLGTATHTEKAGVSRWEVPSTTMQGLADILQQTGRLQLSVKDMTGLVGRYQIDLTVNLKAAQSELASPEIRGDRTAMQTAIMNMEDGMVRAVNVALAKFGLRIVRRKVPVETLVVDHIEKPSEN